MAVAGITTQDAKEDHPVGWASASQRPGGRPGRPAAAGPARPPRQSVADGPGSTRTLAPLLARLSRIHGVESVITVRADGKLDPAQSAAGRKRRRVPLGMPGDRPRSGRPGLVRPAGPRSRPRPLPRRGGSRVIPKFLDAAPPAKSLGRITWPAADVPARQLGGLGLDSIDIATDGSQSAVEQARTELENANAYPSFSTPLTLGEVTAELTTANNAYQQLADVVILASLPIAGCTLAAAVAAGLADRKRPFSLLRLTGARLATLRRVVALEGAVPLLAVAAVSIGVGFGAAAMFAILQLQHPLVAPGAAYYLSPRPGSRPPSASSRPRSRCCGASPAPKSRETNERHGALRRAHLSFTHPGRRPRGRDRGLSRRHRSDVPAAAAHHRPRGPRNE